MGEGVIGTGSGCVRGEALGGMDHSWRALEAGAVQAGQEVFGQTHRSACSLGSGGADPLSAGAGACKGGGAPVGPRHSAASALTRLACTMMASSHGSSLHQWGSGQTIWSLAEELWASWPARFIWPLNQTQRQKGNGKGSVTATALQHLIHRPSCCVLPTILPLVTPLSSPEPPLLVHNPVCCLPCHHRRCWRR